MSRSSSTTVSQLVSQRGFEKAGPAGASPMNMMREESWKRVICIGLTSLLAVTLSSCSLRMSVVGQDWANAACQKLADSQSNDDPAAGLAATYLAAEDADKAAKANPKFESLASAIHAVESNIVSLDAVGMQQSWSRVAALCNRI